MPNMDLKLQRVLDLLALQIVDAAAAVDAGKVIAMSHFHFVGSTKMTNKGYQIINQ